MSGTGTTPHGSLGVDDEREIEFPPCPMHGEGFICDHDPNEDYADVSI